MIEILNKRVYGRSRDPQSQGLLDQANSAVEKMLTAAMEQQTTRQWTCLILIQEYFFNRSCKITRVIYWLRCSRSKNV